MARALKRKVKGKECPANLGQASLSHLKMRTAPGRYAVFTPTQAILAATFTVADIP